MTGPRREITPEQGRELAGPGIEITTEPERELTGPGGEIRTERGSENALYSRTIS
jgi:hypothetical protein